ncbi:DNA translocase FtsK [Bacillus kwashiorkori]|uniref:DNA translocase FtsK n=1 Tax=Bacillus kwashiorkori TaxID=1522318 RepID=UPI0008F869DD|nr:DNA translocase FtsK [Bacillus kwashiorkori]
MDWFKKWFFLTDDHLELDRKNDTDRVRDMKKIKDSKGENQSNIHKEVETRIAFKYPKNPAPIPKHKIVTRQNHRLKSTSINKNIANDREMSEIIPKKEQLQERRKQRKQLQDNQQTPSAKNNRNLLREEKVTQNKRTRPFRPTEVPSPIYGYKHRRPSVENGEFELTGLELNKLDIKYEELLNDCNSDVKTKYIDEEMQKEVLNSWQSETEHDDIPIYQDELENKTDKVNLPFPLLDTGETRENGSLFNRDAQNLEPIVDKQKHIQVVKQDGPHDLKREPYKEVERELEESDVKITQSMEQIQEQQSNHMPNHESKENIEEMHRNDDEQAVKFNELESNSAYNNVRQESKRSHIPFNVLMLKKDKESLAKSMNNHHNLETSKNIANKDDVNDVSVKKSLQGENQSQVSYTKPPFELLEEPIRHKRNHEWLSEQAVILNNALKSFNVGAHVVGVSEGPSVTRFELSPEPGVKVNRITNLSDDLKLSLAARDIRIEAPIPGKHTVGIEIPNKTSRPVFLREIIENSYFLEANSPLTVALGLDISGKPIFTDLQKMPHGLIAGATGSGKSVCINSFIVSLLYKATPEEVKLLLIDPKMVELAPYNNIPHLISPVITDVKAATAALKWAVEEMERRYELFAATGVRNIASFNEKAKFAEEITLPYIVVIIDELADLMMVAASDVEEAICRIAQKARACGIHLLIATQRPSVDVITGLIKANVPTRIAFSVSSQVDSRTIIDMNGAEKLLGKGDMLFLGNGTSKPVRLQGAFISDMEIETVVDHVKAQGEPDYLFMQEELIQKSDLSEQDELFYEACEFAVLQGNISTSSLQRHFRIGYNRAARLIESMEEQGFISEARGSKPRDVLITEQDLLHGAANSQ